jgi:hypothetical protein
MLLERVADAPSAPNVRFLKSRQLPLLAHAGKQGAREAVKLACKVDAALAG